MRLSPQNIADVRITLDSFLEAYSRGDLDQAMSYFLKDETILGFGTGADERNVGWQEHWEQVKRDLSQSTSRQVVIDWFKAGGRDNLAWTAMECSVQAETEAGPFQAKMRATYVLVKTDEGWKIVSSHASMPMTGQEDGQSFPGE